MASTTMSLDEPARRETIITCPKKIWFSELTGYGNFYQEERSPANAPKGNTEAEN